jgi:predicted permease
MKIPLVAGRTFTPSDTADAPRVIMIDEYLAKKYWPGRNPIGGKILRGVNNDDPDFTVIGVVANVQHTDLADQNKMGHIYFDYRQNPQRTMFMVSRSAAGDGQTIAAVRNILRQADPEVALFDTKTMSERISSSLRDRRAAMVICLAFAALALTLSAIGIYGVLAYTVTQRTREFGIRIALGAGVGAVASMVLRQGMLLAGVGLAIGAAGAFALTRLMQTMLFGVKPTDPLVFGGVAAVLMAIAALASLIPSLRVTRIRPAAALRYE